MLAIRLVFYTLSRRPSPVAKKRSRALSRNDRIMRECKATVYNCQEMPYTGLRPLTRSLHLPQVKLWRFLRRKIGGVWRRWSIPKWRAGQNKTANTYVIEIPI
jgi:hypothetical protein